MHEGVSLGAVALMAACFVVWSLVEPRMTRWNISAPIAFVAAGMVLSKTTHAIGDLTVRGGGVLLLCELALAVVLFGDASQVPFEKLEHDAGLPGRLLGIGLPLTIALGTLAARLVFPGLSWWVCAVIGTAVAPTDAALGAVIVEDQRVPRRIRRLLNVESGLNDGLATPIFGFFLAIAAGARVLDQEWGTALRELAVGVLVGAAVGVAVGWVITTGLRRGTASASFVPVSVAATAFLAYSATVTFDGNGFVAAFVSGLAFGASCRPPADVDPVELTHQAGEILSLSVWLLFGALVLEPLAAVGWREVAFAALALTVVRLLPVAAALVGAGLERRTVLVVGWFGPRGLASVVFALLAADVLLPADSERALAAIGATVLASVVLHGATAGPIAARMAPPE